jgi:putative FmdB family regulatory protein
VPIYEYECRSCSHRLEQYQSFKDEPLKKCPECGKMKLARLISGGAGAFMKETRTLGSLADKNGAEMRKAGTQPKQVRRTKPGYKPWWRDSEYPNMGVLKNPQQYIETGKI